MTASEADTLLAEREITKVLTTYCRAVDRIDGELGRSVFHPDATADYGEMFQGSAHDVMDSILEAHRGMLATVHQVGAVTMVIDGEIAGSESYVTARLRARGADETLVDMVSLGRYVDRWERRDGAWRITHRHYVHELGEVRPVEDLGFPTAGKRDRSDASYEVLGGGA